MATNAPDPYWMAMAHNAGLLGGQHVISGQNIGGMQQAVYANPDSWSPHRMKQALMMRLRVPEGHMHPYEFLECCKLNDKEVAVFVVADGEPVVIKDGTDLFPSDTLITQLRLLKK